VVPGNLSDDQKFDLIFSLIQLMKLDERMYREEIKFCGQVAGRLGYNKQVMFELLSHVKSGAMRADEMDSLKKLTQAFLNRQKE
jgi:hypothetical protein